MVERRSVVLPAICSGRRQNVGEFVGLLVAADRALRT
jgi:hypothetical protein